MLACVMQKLFCDKCVLGSVSCLPDMWDDGVIFRCNDQYGMIKTLVLNLLWYTPYDGAWWTELHEALQHTSQ